ncbi:MAG: hypothetical protein WCE81_01410 [Halobacteriota archaeon]
MGMKKAIISLSIIAISTLCLLNVAAASTINPATAPHSKIVTDVKGQQPTTLTFNCPTHAKVNEWVYFTGSLTSGGTGLSNTLVSCQYEYLKNGNWATFTSGMTDSNGNIVGGIKPSVTGDQYYRLSYDGNSQYAPSVSDVVMVTVS